MRKLFLYFAVFLLAISGLSAAKYFSYAGFHVSPHGLALSNWEIDGPASGPSPQLNHPLGKPVEATFTLTNVTTGPLLLSKIYVSCRYSPKEEATGGVESRDFGFANNVLLAPGQSKTLKAGLVLNKAGSWRFWPSYEIGGEKGPLRWHDFIVDAVTKQVNAGSSGGTMTAAGPYLSPDKIKLTGFRLVTPKNPKPGAFAVVDFTLTNASAKPITFIPNGVYISCRVDLPTDVQDFGSKGPRPITLKPGQSLQVHGARKMDKPGLWIFWPGYRIQGGALVPFRWHDLDVVVQK